MTTSTSQTFYEWVASGVRAIDGGLAGELEVRGHDLSDNLWSARLLRDDPGSIQEVHENYVQVGAGVLISASYQASRMGFVQVGLEPASADDLLRESVRLARAASQTSTKKVWVAASVGPYGAVLGGGQEYVGNYGKSRQELAEFHRERIEVLAQENPDVLACETIPDLLEVEALLEVLADFSHIPAWISMSCKNASLTCAGQPIKELKHLVSALPNIAAIGINCTMPEHVTSLLTQLQGNKPLVVYPNAGRVWDGNARQWIGEGMTTIPHSAISEWVNVGASLIGGCCGLGPTAIADLSDQLSLG